MSKRDHLPSWQKELDQQQNDRDKNQRLAGNSETGEEPDWTSLGYISADWQAQVNAWQAQVNTMIQNAAKIVASTHYPQHYVPNTAIAGSFMPSAPSAPLPHRQESGAYRAWRMWWVRPDGTLTAASRDYDWKPGATQAECHSTWGYPCDCGGRGGEIHRVQAREEHPPGVYGYKTLEEMQKDEIRATGSVLRGVPISYSGKKLVIGTVLLWGKMTVAQYGMRAEWGMPEMLFVPDVGSDSYWYMLHQASKKYGMERVDIVDAYAVPTGLIRLRQDGSIEEK